MRIDQGEQGETGETFATQDSQASFRTGGTSRKAHLRGSITLCALSGNKTNTSNKGIASRNKKLLVTKGIATSSKDATSSS